MIRTLAFLSILLCSCARWAGNFHGYRDYLALATATVWLAGIVWKRIHWSAGLALGWALLSGLRVFGNPVSPFIQNGDQAVMIFDSLSATTFIALALVVILILEIRARPRMIHPIISAFSWLCALDSLFVIGQWALGQSSTDRGGFFGNAGMNACVIAMTYPILHRRFDPAKSNREAACGLATLIAPAFAILVSRSNMALAAFLAAWLMPFVLCRKISARTLLTPAVLLACSGILFMGHKFGDNNGRVVVWHATMQWWIAHASHWIGTSLGSYFILGPSVQVYELHQMSGHLLWMHNDWLQILFEQGVIGFVLFSATVGFAFRAAASGHRHWLVAAMAAYAVSALGDYPMHLPVTGFLGAFLLMLAFDRPPSVRKA